MPRKPKTEKPASRWSNRITGHGEEAPDQLLANPKNWRIHPKEQQDALEGVLDEVGWVAEVIVNQRTGMVVDGHLRVQLALSRSEPTIPVRYVDLSEEEEAKVLLTIDPIAGMAVAAEDQLSALLDEVATGSEALGRLLDDMRGPSSVGPEAGAAPLPAPVVKYEIIFDDEEQQSRWFDFLKRLRANYPDIETIAGRLDAHVQAEKLTSEP